MVETNDRRPHFHVPDILYHTPPYKKSAPSNFLPARSQQEIISKTEFTILKNSSLPAILSNMQTSSSLEVIRAENPSSRQARPPSTPCLPCRTLLFHRNVCLHSSLPPQRVPHTQTTLYSPHGSQYVDKEETDIHRRTTRAARHFSQAARRIIPVSTITLRCVGLCERAYHRLLPHTANLYQQHTKTYKRVNKHKIKYSLLSLFHGGTKIKFSGKIVPHHHEKL